MTENNTAETTTDDGAITPVEYEKGSWQDSLQKSTSLKERAGKANKTATNLLWKGAKEGITGWLPESATDVNGEGLYNEVIEALGRSRKGDASKIKTVAVAARVHSLDINTYPNLSKAYAAALDLTKGEQTRADEDDAAEKAIASIEPPKTTGSVEGAAALLLSKGVDGAVVAILDALGGKNEAAHRAFLRAVSTEIAARVQANKPKPAPKAPKAPKAGATAAKKAAAPVKAKAAAPAKAKGKPVAKKVAAPVNDGVETSADPVAEPDMFDAIDNQDAVEQTAAPVAKPVAKKPGKPVVRRPQRG